MSIFQEAKDAARQSLDSTKQNVISFWDRVQPFIHRVILIWALIASGVAVVEFLFLRGVGNLSDESKKKISALENVISQRESNIKELQESLAKAQAVLVIDQIQQKNAEGKVEKVDAFRAGLSGSNWMDDARKYKLLGR